MADTMAQSHRWTAAGPIGVPRRLSGADLCLHVLGPCEIGLAESPRENGRMSPFLSEIGAAALPYAGYSSGSDAAQLLAITDESFFIVGCGRRIPVEAARVAFDVFVDVSHAWTRMAISGSRSSEFLAKGCALDLHPQVFPAGTCAATGFAMMRVVIWRPDDGNRYDMMVGRSYAASLWDWLLDAARDYGCKDIVEAHA